MMRSISPEISSVIDLRSGIAALISWESYSRPAAGDAPGEILIDYHCRAIISHSTIGVMRP